MVDTVEILVVKENEIAVSMAAQIESKVQRIRELKESISEKQNMSGITTDEEEIQNHRVELLELCREYKTLVGENWTDSEGYARYVSPGETRKYDVDRVDQTLASLLALQAELDKIVDDTEFEFTLPQRYGDGSLAALSGKASFSVIASMSVVDPDAVELLRQIQEHYQKQAMDARLRIEAIDKRLKELAAARKTSTTSEAVAVK